MASPVFLLSLFHIPAGYYSCNAATFKLKNDREKSAVTCWPHCYIMSSFGFTEKRFYCKHLFCLFRFYSMAKFYMNHISIIPFKLAYLQSRPLLRYIHCITLRSGSQLRCLPFNM